MKKPRLFFKQGESTIGGFIFGLIAGLAMAVIIALYITRSPTPFVEHARPTIEPLNNHFTADANSNSPEAENTLNELPRIVEIPPPHEKAETEMSEQTVQSMPTTRISPAKTLVDSNYYLQIGTYRTQAEAEQQRAQLALQGLEAQVSRRGSGHLIYYRVWLGPFANFGDINSVRQRLSGAGIDAIVIRDEN